MKFYAVFRTVSEKHIEIEAADWQEAARKASCMERPQIVSKGSLEYVASAENEADEYYQYTHEIVGECHKCGLMILDGCGKPECPAQHTGPGGWVSTEHGHVTWCSVGCRQADVANDPEAPNLDLRT